MFAKSKKEEKICSHLQLYRDVAEAARIWVMLVKKLQKTQGYSGIYKAEILGQERWHAFVFRLNVISEFFSHELARCG